MDNITVRTGLDLVFRFDIEQQVQAFADVGERHLVACGSRRGLPYRRVANFHVQSVVVSIQSDVDDTPFRQRLDAVVDGILQQRLQNQGRNERVRRHVLHIPAHLEAFAQTQFFNSQVLPRKLHFLAQCDQFVLVCHGRAEQIRHVFQRNLGALGIGAHDAQHGVDGVEQEVRPDARLQRLQPRFMARRRERLCP